MHSETYSILLAGVMSVDDFAVLSDVQRGQAVQFAAWLCAEQIVWQWLYYAFG
jgi:hypothetical protein